VLTIGKKMNTAKLWPRVGARSRAVIPLFLILSSFFIRTSTIAAQDLPSNAGAQIRAAWAQARNWKHDAKFLYLGFTRDNARQGYETEFVFGADSAPGVAYHIMRGPRGSTSGMRPPVTQPVVGLLRPADIVIGMMNSKVIDPAQAVNTAYKHGMKGNVLSVQLQCWGAPAALEVWRIIPDNDLSPDPNDPTMKNYIVDAMTGDFYSYLYYAGTNVDPVAYARSLGAFTMANIQEFMQGLGQPQGK
jgi:hypothetical protein